MSDDAERKARIKQDFIDARGYWSWGWDPLLDMSPDYFAAYAKLSSVPWKPGSLLSPKVLKELRVSKACKDQTVFKVSKDQAACKVFKDQTVCKEFKV